MSGPRPVAWSIWAIIAGGPIIVGLLIWQLFGMVPARWCAAGVGAAKMQGQKASVEDCTSIILRLLDIKDHAVVGLLGVLGIVYIVLVVTAVKARVGFTAPGGIALNVGGDAVPVDINATGTITPADPAVTEETAR